MKEKEIEKAKAYVTAELIEYLPRAVVSRTIIKKLTGNVTAFSFENGEGLTEKTTPFDTYVQIIEGKARLVSEVYCDGLGDCRYRCGLRLPAF